MKWLAVVLMIGDHVDWMLCGGELGFHATIGRIVFPMFAWAFAYNLARPGAREQAAFRSVTRLTLLGLAAMPAYVILSGVLPLNIMFTLAAFAAIVAMVERGDTFPAVVTFVVAGAVVDYAWPGLAVCLSLWAAYRYDSRWIVAAGFSLAILEVINGSQWALAALPVIAVASMVRVDLPRAQIAFYAVYPVHLTVLAIAAVL